LAVAVRPVKLDFAAPFLLGLPLIIATTDARTADAVADSGSIPVPAMTVPQSGYLTSRAKEVLITHDAWDLNGFTAPSGDPNAQVESADLQASCAAHSKTIIEGRLNQEYPAIIEHKTIGGAPADVVTPKSGIADRNRNRVLINMHGGGFIGKCPDGLVEAMPIAATGRIKVITVDYREAPEAKFPAASEDVTAVYRELLKSYPADNIGLYGCSAGGVLAGQATAWIITHRLPRPGAVGVFCAGLADWRGDSLYTARFLPSNPTTGIMHLMTYTKDIETTDRTLYPANQVDLLSKFPPVLFVTATRDMAMSNAMYSHNQLAKAGVESDLRVWDGLGHAFILDDLPEAKDANNIIVRFFDKHLGTGAMKRTHHRMSSSEPLKRAGVPL
jgi:monoterpene epsilon-lactone hydrolase